MPAQTCGLAISISAMHVTIAHRLG
jgi:hypothetical protein